MVHLDIGVVQLIFQEFQSLFLPGIISVVENESVGVVVEVVCQVAVLVVGEEST